MKKLSALPLIGALALSIALIFGIFLWMNPTSSVQAISIDEAITAVKDLYDGSVLESREEGNEYIILLERELGIYEVKVSSETGVVHSLQLIEKTQPQQTEQDNKTTNSVIPEKEVKSIVQLQTNGKIESIQLIDEHSEIPKYQVNVNEQTQKLTLSIHALTGEILDKQSENIEQPLIFISKEKAAEIAKGYLNGNVNYTSLESNGKQSYYVVEVQSSSEKVIIQINAVTGEVLSVTSETFNVKPEQNSNDNDDDDDDHDDDDDDDDDD